MRADSRFSFDVTAAMLVYRTIAKKVLRDFDLLLCKTWGTFCRCFVHQHGHLIASVKTKNRTLQFCFTFNEPYPLFTGQSLSLSLFFFLKLPYKARLVVRLNYKLNASFFPNIISSQLRIILPDFSSFYSLLFVPLPDFLHNQFMNHSSFANCLRLVYFRPTVVLSFVLWLFQLFLSFFVFSDREFPNITITVDNRCINAENCNINKELK